MVVDETARLDRIEAMLQVLMEQICVLTKVATGREMCVGYFENCEAIGATSQSEYVKVVGGGVPENAQPRKPAKESS